MSETNGHLTHTKEQLLALKETYQLQAEVESLKYESLYWGNLLQDWKTGRDRVRQFQMYPDVAPSTVSDRKQGRNYPLFRTDQELNVARNNSRYLADTNSFAINICNQHVSSVIGTGGHFDCEDKEILDLLSTWAKRVNLNAEADPFLTHAVDDSIEQQIVLAWLIDGECFYRQFRWEFRPVEPVRIRNPARVAEGDGWSFGIRTDPFDVLCVEEYHVGTELGTEGEFPAAEEVVFAKRPGVPSNVKRGWPKFYGVAYDALRKAEELIPDIAHSASERARIGWVQKFPPLATPAQIKNMAGQGQYRPSLNPNVPADVNTDATRTLPAVKLSVPDGTEFLPPPRDDSASFGEAAAGLLRMAAAAFSMTEAQLTADSDVSSLASLQEAGTPWIREVQRWQTKVTTTIVRMATMFLQWAANEGYTDEARVRRAVKTLKYCLPDVTITDQSKQSAVLSTAFKDGAIDVDEYRTGLGFGPRRKDQLLGPAQSPEPKPEPEVSDR